MLLRAILAKQNEQNALLQALVKKQYEQTRHVVDWKKKHPELSQRCQKAAEKAAQLMDNLVECLVNDLEELEHEEGWDGSAFELNEFIDKYGHKFPQFSIILQMLSQLGEQ